MDKCALCLNPRPLLNSHFIPRSLYKLCKKEFHEINNPIHFIGNTAISTSNQSSKPFLCKDCEDRFSKYGETYVINNCLRSPSRFKLRELLENSIIFTQFDNTKVFLGKQILGENLEYYKYFVASIVWRGSATKWPFMDSTARQNILGEKYQEEFRRYLLGEVDFPKNAFLSLFISEDKDLYPMIVLPNSDRKEGIHLHHFYIPGIEIKLFIGNKHPCEFEQIRIKDPSEVLIFLELFRNSELFSSLAQSAKNAEYKGVLKKMNKCS